MLLKATGTDYAKVLDFGIAIQQSWWPGSDLTTDLIMAPQHVSSSVHRSATDARSDVIRWV